MRKPSQIASHLANVVAKINNSKKPDRSLVAVELRRVAAELDPLTPSQIASQACMQAAAQDEFHLDDAIVQVKKYCAQMGIDQQLCDQACKYAEHYYANMQY